jgi:hypothetical protein
MFSDLDLIINEEYRATADDENLLKIEPSTLLVLLDLLYIQIS